MDLASSGASEGVVLVADHQTAGRGRLDRTWESPPASSLLVSVLLRPAIQVSEAHLVVLAFGIAAAEACRIVAGVDVGLKWPNDLVVAARTGPEAGVDRKLGGLLAESVIHGDVVTAIVAGMGLNANWPGEVPEFAQPATALNQIAGHDVDREELLIAVLQRFDDLYSMVVDRHRRQTIISLYRGLCRTIGQPVRVSLSGPGGENREIFGDAVDIHPDGHLVLSTLDGRLDVTAGDVTHLRPGV